MEYVPPAMIRLTEGSGIAYVTPIAILMITLWVWVWQ